MDSKSALKYGQTYADEVKKRFSAAKVFMYGSHIYGNPTDESDIDIAVIFNGFNGDWLKTSSDLWEITENVNTTIEPVLLDMSRDKSGFAHHIMQTGVEL